MNAQDLRNHIAKQCGFNKAKQGEVNAVQVCSAGEWPETDHGGNWTPDRREANIAFSEWLDQQGDSIVPSSFSEWLGSEDSIFIE